MAFADTVRNHKVISSVAGVLILMIVVATEDNIGDPGETEIIRTSSDCSS